MHIFAICSKLTFFLAKSVVESCIQHSASVDQLIVQEHGWMSDLGQFEYSGSTGGTRVRGDRRVFCAPSPVCMN